jgi:hypothetical protein
MKKFKLIFLASSLILTAILSTTAFSTHQEKSPRLKCLEGCQATHISCLAGAKDSKGNTDPTKASACNKALNDCIKTCPQNP